MSEIKLATRKAFGEALLSLGDKNSRVLALDADLSKSTFSYLFGEKYPDRFFQMGIAEANMIGVAAGMALSGYIPFACSFACFITGRFDQIKMSIAYSNAAVRVVGTHAGVGIGEDGYSQQALEDIALMRSLPTMQVFQPADDIETHAMVNYLAQNHQPAYLRLTRQNLQRVHSQDHIFTPGKFSVLKEGDDIGLFATGGTVQHALEAAQKLASNNIGVKVYNASSIKPIDEEAIINECKSKKLLFSVEDHNIMGGLGSAIAECMAKRGNNPRLVQIGIKDEFGESGTPDDLYHKHGLSADKIASCVIKEWQRV